MKAPIASIRDLARGHFDLSRSQRKSRNPALRKTLAVFVACAGLASVAFAGVATDPVRTLTVEVTDATGQSVGTTSLSSIVNFDPTTGATGTPAPGTALPSDWSWSTANLADSGAPLATPALTWHNAEGKTDNVWNSLVQIATVGNVDPFLSYSFSAKNSSAIAQTYTITYGESIVPTIFGDFQISADFGGSLTHGLISPFAEVAPVLGDLDGDGVSEIQTLKLSSDGGLTFLNAGIDLGQTQTRGPSGTSIFGPIAESITGSMPLINYWEFEVKFTLTPGKDAVALSGFAEIVPIPESSTSAALMGAIMLLGVGVRRFLYRLPA